MRWREPPLRRELPQCRRRRSSTHRQKWRWGCVGLAYASVETAKIFGVHEPCEAGYLSGANFITAETGANPRDTALDTSKARGWDMARCRKLMFECGFTSLLKGDGSSVRLNYDYLKKTDSDF